MDSNYTIVNNNCKQLIFSNYRQIISNNGIENKIIELIYNKYFKKNNVIQCTHCNIYPIRIPNKYKKNYYNKKNYGNKISNIPEALLCKKTFNDNHNLTPVCYICYNYYINEASDISFAPMDTTTDNEQLIINDYLIPYYESMNLCIYNNGNKLCGNKKINNKKFCLNHNLN
tara:strand:+ start:2231 stop:2746 length:516 start_codon:yes stop_codon:yes gene_type:complete